MRECIYTEGAAFRPKNPAMFGVCMLTRGEEVIRCRDCTHMFEMMDGFECERMSGQYHACEPDGFCAWAERRKS